MTDLSPEVPEDVVAGLADVLSDLGRELRRANLAGESTIMFGGADVELEVAAVAEAGGGVKFWVVNAGAKGSLQRTAKITVHVYPGGDAPMGVGK